MLHVCHNMSGSYEDEMARNDVRWMYVGDKHEHDDRAPLLAEVVTAAQVA